MGTIFVSLTITDPVILWWFYNGFQATYHDCGEKSDDGGDGDAVAAADDFWLPSPELRRNLCHELAGFLSKTLPRDSSCFTSPKPNTVWGPFPEFLFHQQEPWERHTGTCDHC